MTPCNSLSAFLDQMAGYSLPQCLNGIEEVKWRPYSTQEALEQVRLLALGLVANGLKEGSCVGLMALPSPRWTLVSLAIIAAGGVLVPLFPNVAEENFTFQVKQTNMQWIFVDTRLSVRTPFTHLFSLGNDYNALLAKGREVQQDKWDQLRSQMQEERLASIFYTSGSTGQPKGVELTQRNLLAHLSQQPWDLKSDGDRYLSILPLAHIFGFSVNMIMLGWGVPIFYSNDIKNLKEVCQEIRPSIIIVVPRLLEKMQMRMVAKARDASGLKKLIGQWALNLAYQEKKSFFHKLIDRLVYAKIRKSLGGRLRIVVSGGAPLNPQLNRFYQNVGIPVVEGWGMTEGCPITVNTPTKNKIGTVGVPFKGIELKISSEGEVCVRGSLVMRGYYQNPELTSNMLDSDGWLHTGDRGALDDEGYLTLQGRLKELFKTSTGEYVAPVPIEQLICRAPLIEAAMVVAEGRPFASCLLFPNKEVMENLKETQAMNHMSDQDFLDTPFVKQEMDRLLEEVNTHLNHWEQLHAYRFIPYPPSVEGGELTPTLKLRRRAIFKKYEPIINSIYTDGVSA